MRFLIADQRGVNVAAQHHSAVGSNAPSDDSAGGSCKGTRTSSDDCSTSRMISSFSEAGYQRRASHDQRDLERARVESAVSEIVAEWCAKCH